jgi:IMP dehydrogenase
MDQHGVSGLPVVDPSGALVGVVSQRDVARARSTEYLWANWPGLAVRHLMTTPAVTVRRSIPLAVAIRRMERMRIHRLVVVDDRDPELPIGMLSLTDVVHSIALERLAPAAADHV